MTQKEPINQRKSRQAPRPPAHQRRAHGPRRGEAIIPRRFGELSGPPPLEPKKASRSRSRRQADSGRRAEAQPVATTAVLVTTRACHVHAHKRSRAPSGSSQPAPLCACVDFRSRAAARQGQAAHVTAYPENDRACPPPRSRELPSTSPSETSGEARADAQRDTQRPRSGARSHGGARTAKPR